MTAFVVTTSIHGISRSLIWDASAPLILGHPLRWILEKTEKGLRARDLAGPLDQIRKPAAFELTHEQLVSGATLPLTPPLSVTIRKTRTVAPVSESSNGETLRIFTCTGAWIQSSETLGKSGLRTPAFELTRDKDSTYRIVLGNEAICISGSGLKREPNTPFAVQAQELRSLVIRQGGTTWRFGLIRELEARESDFNTPARKDVENLSFQAALRYSAAALGVFFLMAFLWPKPRVSDELIPAQYAKIILSAPTQTEKDQKEAGGSTSSVAQNTARKAVVVQAFRAKALQNSISGLLKGGMTRLLAQSDIVSGTTRTAENRRLFDTKNTGLLATGSDIGLMNSKSVLVASLGGAGVGTGSGIGYGKGHHAGIVGQGQSHVSLDIGNSVVEEGLTKDEVGEVIHKHLSDVRYCYESAILRTPGIEGRLIVNFTIGGNGIVKTSEVKQSTLPDPRLDDCILRRLVTWKFPQTKGGIDVAVTYPFIFKMLGLGR